MNRLREIMQERGITQEELSVRTGISQGALSKIINNKKEITLSTARKISNALKLPLDYIWPY